MYFFKNNLFSLYIYFSLEKLIVFSPNGYHKIIEPLETKKDYPLHFFLDSFSNFNLEKIEKEEFDAEFEKLKLKLKII